MFGPTRLARILTCAALACAPLPLHAQAQESQPSEGRIVGRIMDAESGRTLPGAQVVIDGTSTGVLAGVDGRYILLRVPAGVVDVRAVMIGFSTKTITGVVVPPGGACSTRSSSRPQRSGARWRVPWTTSAWR
jgi:hypothetical protein